MKLGKLSGVPDEDPWTHLQGGNTLDANAFEYRPPQLSRRAVSDAYGAPPLYALQRGDAHHLYMLPVLN